MERRDGTPLRYHPHLVSPQLRVQPTSHLELVEYFLNTEGDEMQYEVARCRPLVTAEFTTYLGQAIGTHLVGWGGRTLQQSDVACFWHIGNSNSLGAVVVSMIST